MLAEQQRRSLGDQVQYLTDRQLEQLVEQTPGNDIKDYEDLQSGRSGVGTQETWVWGTGRLVGSGVRHLRGSCTPREHGYGGPEG